MIKSYFLKFYDKVKMLENKEPNILILSKYAFGGIFDYFMFGSTITDYFELTFFNKSLKEKSKYMTWRNHKKFIYKVDNSELIDKLANKKEMYLNLRDFLNRKQVFIKDCSFSQFNNFIKESPKFLYKPCDGSCGNGIEIYDTKNINSKKLFDELKKKPDGILDQLIVQHHILNELNPSSVNTLRIFTFRTNDTIYFAGASLRVGTTSFIDNYSAGGIVLSIDMKKGIVNHEAEDYIGKKYRKHPITGVKLIGFKIPNWDKVIDFVFNIACSYDLNYVAWDIAVCENHVDLVEANPAGMINVIQIAGAEGKKNLYKKLSIEWEKNPYKGNKKKFGKEIC